MYFACAKILKFLGFFETFSALFVLSGISAVILVAYDRMALVALTADARITKRTAPRIIAISWIISVCLAIPWIVFRRFWVRY